MLSPADAALVARDPQVPGLAALLDADRLAALLGAPVEGPYLRYKPGTSCVLGGRLPGGRDVLVAAYAAEAAGKAGKALAAAPAGAVLGHDPALGLVATRAEADRDLPALTVLADDRRRRRLLRELLDAPRGLRQAAVTTLSYNPQRRWVGRLDLPGGAAVLRAYRPEDAAAAVAAVQALAPAPVRTPRLLGTDAAVGLLALEHLAGVPLDAALRARSVSTADLRAAGRALAALHGAPVTGLPQRTAADDARAVRSAADQVAVLVPELRATAARLADEVARRLAAVPVADAALHGDFSADQVLVTGDGVALIDLDRAAAGHPAVDLGGVAAALTAARLPEAPRVLAALHAGYAEVRALPDDGVLALHTAAALLRRAAEPFRTRAADWPDRVRALLAEAAGAAGAAAGAAVAPAPGPLERSPADVLEPLLGGPVRLEVLKDKPGRRRTSRARGPAGTAIVKVYASGRAPVVAARVAALADGPSEPVVPRVLRCDPARHLVVLSEVPGTPFAKAVVAGDTAAAARVGRALAAWHGHHRGRRPAALKAHTAEREGDLLLARAQSAAPAIGDAVRAAAPALLAAWDTDTVVHRDLYEEQLVLDDRVGLLDLDDAALGPAELDLGNLAAHLQLLTSRTGTPTAAVLEVLLSAYASEGPLDRALLDRCRRLSLLRLACIHRDAALLPRG